MEITGKNVLSGSNRTQKKRILRQSSKDGSNINRVTKKELIFMIFYSKGGVIELSKFLHFARINFNSHAI